MNPDEPIPYRLSARADNMSVAAEIEKLPEDHWQRLFYEELRKGLREVTARLADEASHTEEGRREGIRWALNLFLAVCGNCGVCEISRPAHPEPFPCSAWDLLEVLCEGPLAIRLHREVKEPQLTVLRKIWALKP